MQTTGDRVALAAKFGPGVKGGHHRLQRRGAGYRVDVYGDSPAIIFHLNPTVLVDGDIHLIAAAGYSFIDAVIDDLVHKMVKPPLPGAADIHAGAAAHCLKATQDLDVLSGVIIIVVHLCVFDFYPPLKTEKAPPSPKARQSFTTNKNRLPRKKFYTFKYYSTNQP